MSPARPADPMHGGAATKALPGKGGCAPKPVTQLETPHSLLDPLHSLHIHIQKKETEPQDFWGLRHRQALKSYSKMIIHKNFMVLLCSLIALARRCPAQP